MSFDLLAPHYRWMECVLAGRKLQRCRTAFLDQVSAAERILILGEGNGRFLVECCRRFPLSFITCVDASEQMLMQARTRIHRHGVTSKRVEFIRADALRWKPPGPAFDLLVTHFFLDCFRADQLERLVGMLAGVAGPGATWLLADFRIPASGLCRYRAQLIHWLMYRFFTVVAGLHARQLTIPDPFLSRNGFALLGRQISEWGLLHSDRWKKGGPPWGSGRPLARVY